MHRAISAVRLGRWTYRVVIVAPRTSQFDQTVPHEASEFRLSLYNPVTNSVFSTYLPGNLENEKHLLDLVHGTMVCCSYMFIRRNGEVSQNEGSDMRLELNLDNHRLTLDLEQDPAEIAKFQTLEDSHQELKKWKPEVENKLQELKVQVRKIQENVEKTNHEFYSQPSFQQLIEELGRMKNELSSLTKRKEEGASVFPRSRKGVINLRSSKSLTTTASQRNWDVFGWGDQKMVNVQDLARKIEVAKTGYYLVTSRITTSSPAGDFYSSVLMNGREVARSYIGGGPTPNLNSSTITEIFHVTADSYFNISCTFINDISDPVQNQICLVNLSQLTTGWPVIGKWSSTVGVGNTKAYTWNSNPIPPSTNAFAMKDDELTINEDGCYYVSVRATVCIPATANTNFLSLKLNENTESARAYGGCHEPHFESFIVSEVFRFSRGSKLKVHHNLNGGHWRSAESNVFSIMKLHDSQPVAKYQSSFDNASNQNMRWAESLCTSNIFCLNADASAVVISQPGTYLISIRTTAVSTDGNFSIILSKRGDTIISKSSNPSSSVHGGFRDSFYLDEVFQFTERTELRVKFSFGGEFTREEFANRFSIIQLSPD